MVDIDRALELPGISIPSHDIRSLRQQDAVLLRLPSIPGAAVERSLALVVVKKRQEYQLQWVLHMQKIVGVH